MNKQPLNKQALNKSAMMGKAIERARRASLFAGLLAGAGLLVACQGSDVILPDGARACGERPDVPPEQVACPMIYDPVCGLDAAAVEVGPFGNSCQACAQPAVVYYTPGECGEDRTR
ncbi:hypothetical protein K8B33_06385 [Alcanivorax sp. JB21]|uniref:hypothetical protein n=1 Tax=Alcanivorax limicola TaxID=2874102 RepID=UPI001CBC7014|nr:hypothetical protein [Alcanivorax limicola]MBZ2188714.1 hypothetical protein [Alcanivorax limicola]